MTRIFALSLLPGSLKMRFRILINRSLCTVFNMHSSYFAQPRPKKSWLPSFARVFRRLGTLLASDHSPAQRFRSLRCACRKDSRWSSWEVTWTSNSFKMLFSFWEYPFPLVIFLWYTWQYVDGSPEAHFLGAQEHDSSPFFFDFLWKYQDLTEFFSASGLFAPPNIIHFGYGTTAVAPLINKLFSQCFRYFMSLAGHKNLDNFSPFYWLISSNISCPPKNPSFSIDLLWGIHFGVPNEGSGAFYSWGPFFFSAQDQMIHIFEVGEMIHPTNRTWMNIEHGKTNWNCCSFWGAMESGPVDQSKSRSSRTSKTGMIWMKPFFLGIWGVLEFGTHTPRYLKQNFSFESSTFWRWLSWFRCEIWLCQAEFPKPAGSRLGIQLSLAQVSESLQDTMVSTSKSHSNQLKLVKG